jgi:hypothetical protein
MAGNDILSQLGAFSWTGQGGQGTKYEFPVTEMTVGMSHDMAEHKFWKVDGEELENTGRNALVFSCKALFKNHITPGKNENFSTLYPSVYRGFFLSASDGSTGVLGHPEFGPINCKVMSVNTDWRATTRDGVEVDCVWKETLTQNDISRINGNISPVNNVQTFAGDLDRELGSTIYASRPEFKPDFFDTLTQATSVFDQVTIQSHRVVGKIDQMGYRLNRIGDAIGRAVTPPRTTVASIINPFPSQTNRALTTMYWPLRQSVESMKAALDNFRQTLLESGRPIVFYRVPQPISLAGITIATKAPVQDLMNLNPGLVRTPYIPTGATVRYYSPVQK